LIHDFVNLILRLVKLSNLLLHIVKLSNFLPTQFPVQFLVKLNMVI